MSIEYVYPSQQRGVQTASKAIGAPDGTASAPDSESTLWGADGFTFGDLLDAINPLQQLPLIGNLYRHMTGESLSAGSRMLGGTLIGGPIGFLSSLVNAAIESATGSDIGGHALAFLDDVPTGTQYAAAQYGKAAKLS